MIELNVEQGGEAWVQARLGIPTASQFSRIVTPKGALSKQRDGYLAELLAEWALGEPVTPFYGTEWTERGLALEPEAFSYYGLVTGQEPRRPGFILRDETRSVGASPDMMIGEEGTGEMKCPQAGTHLLWLVRGICPPEHWCQVQGELWVTQRPWCDFFSYYPGLPPFIMRVEPDADFQAALDKALPVFVEELLEGRKKLEAMGVRQIATREPSEMSEPNVQRGPSFESEP